MLRAAVVAGASSSPSRLRPTCLNYVASRSFMSTQAVLDSDDSCNSHILLMLGKPGGGKGTISNKLLHDFPQFHHISTGDILRQHVRDQSSLGVKAQSYMDKGQLVPDNLMIELVLDDATPYMENGESLLLDGFPRNLEQAQALEQVVHIDIVVNLDVPTETIVERIADRWIHPGSGRIYSYSYAPPKQRGIDDETGEPLEQRDDDKPAAVRQRLAAYDKVTAPLVEFYEKKGVLGTFRGTMSDVIYPEVKAWLLQKDLAVDQSRQSR